MEVIAYQFQPLLDSIRAAVKDENWHAALALTLTLPDICARIENPGQTNKTAYIKWWNDNFGQNYRYGNGSNDFVKGEEVYLLRCAYLHEGSDELDPTGRQKLNAVIEQFHFVASARHLEKHGNTVLLHVKQFCEDMCSKVEKWERNVVTKNLQMQNRADELAKIYLPLRITATTTSSAAVTVRLLRTCTNCGNLFPQEEHESLCGDCR